jgi:AcrR family transcriptional regulator
MKMKENNAIETKSFRQIRYEEKKEAIIKSAAKAFGRKDFQAATIEEIAKEIKMTKGSLYYYFSTKEELLYQAHLLSLNKVISNIEKINDTVDPPELKMEKAIKQHLEVFAKDFEGAFLLQQEYNLPEPYRKEIISLRDNYQRNFISIIEEGVKKKVFEVKDIKIAAFCMLGAINWFLRWYSSEGRLSAEEIAREFTDFFFKGLLTRNKEPQQKNIPE